MYIRVETKYDFDLIKKDREFSDAYDKYLAPIRKEQSEIFAKKHKYIVENNLYYTLPLSEKYRNSMVKKISFVNKGGYVLTLQSYHMEDEPIITIDSDGWPYYCSDECGKIIHKRGEDHLTRVYKDQESVFEYIGVTEVEFYEDEEE